MDPAAQDVPKPNGSNGAAQVMPEAEVSHAPSRLKLAIRKARVDEAEHSEVIAELRGAEIARLEMLQEELRPVLADVPKEVDIFDLGLMPGERPRLFIDMIGFVEMCHDRRTYRFVQDTRHGRVIVAESERLEPMIDAVTDYIARRLIERDKALVADTTIEQAAQAYAAKKIEAVAKAVRPPANPTPAAPARENLFNRTLTFFVEVFGSTVLFALLAIGFWNAWRLLAAWWSTHHGG